MNSTTDSGHKTPWLYRAVLGALALPIVLITLWQAFKAGGARYFLQRCGYRYPACGAAPLWLHAASVGEVMAALPLIEALRLKYPRLPLVISTFTATGAQVARSQLPKDIEHVFLPIDWRGAVTRFVRHLRPRCALIMETELWPNLYAACNQQGIPLLIVNGRLSARTSRTRGGVRRLYAATLRRVDAVLARSAQDRAAFIRMGALPEHVRVIGNIKFAPASAHHHPAPAPLARPYVLAASTHADEERRIATLWCDLDTAGRLLVIAPRHPRRRDEILKALSPLHMSIAVRSANAPVTDATRIYLADTLGELQNFMAHAELVFMGGSLVAVGGHNILEPARVGKPIVFGPHMHNFTYEAQIFLAARAAIQVHSDAELAQVLKRLLNAPQERRALGEHARQLMEQAQDIVPHYVQEISPYLERSPPFPGAQEKDRI